MRPSVRPVGFLVPLLALGCTWACGASYQSVYEGDVRFEHCYRLDEEAESAVADKRRCWADWVQRHARGQTRDRVEYATTRANRLAQAQGLSDGPAPATVACPMPTSAFAPPPKTLTVDAGIPPDALVLLSGSGSVAGPQASKGLAPNQPSKGETGASLPGSSCSGPCAQQWDQCRGGCGQRSCTSACEDAYRSCMKRCF